MTRAAYKPMSPVHERNLVRRLKRGCEASARELLDAHAWFLYSQALHYSRVQGIERDDALQEARAGFIHGAKRFNTKSGYKLITYAAHWVRHYCKRYVENTVGDLRTPVYVQTKSYKATGTFRPMRADRLNGRAPGLDGVEMIDTIASNDVLPEAAAAEAKRQERMRAAYQAALATLGPLERAIAVERLARDVKDRATFKSIGDRFGLCRERVRQIEVNVKAKMRKRIAWHGGRALLAA